MTNKPFISVTVCYAHVHRQEVVSVMLPLQATVLQAIQESGILGKYPEVDLLKNNAGIFGEVVGLDQALLDRDRVEIYRPLSCNPMKARHRRAAAQGQQS